MISPFIALILAIISPFIWAIMNLVDKYVVDKKVKNPLSFVIISGFINLFIGLVLAIFSDWSLTIAFSDLIFPALAGIIFGLQYYLYFYVISKEDVSNVIGLVYIYPLFIAILSFFFLNEKLSLYGYMGMFLVILGAVMLSTNVNKLKSKILSLGIFFLIVTTALYEFLFKVTTNNLPELNGLAITQIFIGLSIMLGFFNKKIRIGVIEEIKNFKWILFTEILTFLGVITTFYAMAGLPATIVATIAATQPLAVLLFEKLFHIGGIKLSKDKRIMPKLIPISLIVLGVIILSLS